MAILGKCLVFYLKYPIEMRRLYEAGEEPEGLEDREHTLEMVQAVGDAGSRQAGEFLKDCGQCVYDHFNSIARCQVVSKQTAMEKRWSVSCGVWLKGKYKPPKNKFKVMAGVDVLTKEGGIVAPWLWLQGKTAGEEQLVNLLRERVKARAQEMEWESGTVALAKIPIMPEGLSGFDVDSDALLKQVKEVFKTITPTDLATILALAG